MKHMNIDKRGSSYMVSTDSKDIPSDSKTESPPSIIDSKSRTKSTGDLASPNQDDFDYEDDFYDNSPVLASPEASPRATTAWTAAASLPQSVDTSTQTVESKGKYTFHSFASQ